MSDLIDRQAAINFFTELWECIGTIGDREEWEDVCVTTVNEIKSAQPRKGKWLDYSDEGYVECPFCHSATNCDGNKDELHYCFSCGAELRGEQDD